MQRCDSLSVTRRSQSTAAMQKGCCLHAFLLAKGRIGHVADLVLQPAIALNNGSVRAHGAHPLGRAVLHTCQDTAAKVRSRSFFHLTKTFSVPAWLQDSLALQAWHGP